MEAPFRMHRKWCRGLTVLLGAAATVACNSTAMTDPANPAVKLSVSPATVTSQESPPAATVAVAQSTVTVTGYLTTPYPCYDISATQQTSRGVLVLHLTASSNAPSCAAVLATFRFVATATQVPSSISRVRVEQVGAVAGFPAVLVDQTVALP